MLFMATVQACITTFRKKVKAAPELQQVSRATQTELKLICALIAGLYAPLSPLYTMTPQAMQGSPSSKGK